MAERGDLYLGRYEGWYSVRDEAFYDDNELTDGEGGEKLSPQGTPVEWTVEESWFFKLSAYQQPLARPLCRASRLHPARQPPQRGAALRRGRPQRPVDLAHQLRLGGQGPGQPRPRHVRLARRADQLSDRGRLSRRRRIVRALLAGRHPSDRQGRRALPRGLLAGIPDVGGHRASEAGLWPRPFCSSAARKCRRASAMSSIRSSWPKLYGVDALRYFLLREVTFGQDGSYSARSDRQPRQRRARQQLRQSRPAQPVDDFQEFGRRSSRGGRDARGSRLARPGRDGLHRAPPRRIRAASLSPPASKRG